MAGKFGGNNPKCPRCGKSVYHAEKKEGGGFSWHQNCFTCHMCNKRLDSTTLNTHEGEIYCGPCHGGAFGPTGFRSGGQGAMMKTQGETSQMTWAAPSGPSGSGGGRPTVAATSSGGGRPTAAASGGGGGSKFCSNCGTKSSGGRFCSGCGNQL
eukprot:TRINITY_DN1020_c0_g1_i1.p1 TRINITY_DN1020_c0_g1~~TRINITY_DN1020_c0_g1_i1.p1  ORF type:complete len:163 (-),score=51.48 TRINITY_DN1020_c0_g1_i1:40-501(-)